MPVGFAVNGLGGKGMEMAVGGPVGQAIGYTGALRGTTAAAAATDPYKAFVTFAIGANGTNAIKDTSASGLTINSTGGVTIANQPSGFVNITLDGTTGYITAASPGNAAKFPGDFTLEGWYKLNSITNTNTIYECRGGNDSTGFSLYVNTSGQLYVNNGATLVNPSAATLLSIGVWTYIKYRRNGSVLTLSINEVDKATGSDSTNYSDGVIQFGKDWTTDFNAGVLGPWRITNGIGRVPNGVIPTTPY